MKRIASFVLAALMMATTEAGSVKQLVAETVMKSGGSSCGCPGPTCCPTCGCNQGGGGDKAIERVERMVDELKTSTENRAREAETAKKVEKAADDARKEMERMADRQEAKQINNYFFLPLISLNYC